MRWPISTAPRNVYRQLGFTVGARNRHPWGTHNHIVQLPGFFIELLTLAEPDKMTGDVFSEKFGAYNRDFVDRGDGLSMLVLESHRRRWLTKRRSAPPALPLPPRRASTATARGRTARRSRSPSRWPLRDDKQAPDASFFTCQQHYPENFWNPAFQQHDNGVTGIAGVVLVADEPAQHRDFLLAFTGAAAARDERDGFTIDLPRGAISVVDACGIHGAFRPASAGHRTRRAAGGVALQGGRSGGCRRDARTGGNFQYAAEIRGDFRRGPWRNPDIRTRRLD